MDETFKSIKTKTRLISNQGMNNTEARWDLVMRERLQSGRILWYAFEGVKLRLGKNLFYTPDFIAITGDGSVAVYEVKGFWRDDARVKIKSAAYLFPWIQFHAVSWKNHQWEMESFYKEQ